jgi:hypothetical protein
MLGVFGNPVRQANFGGHAERAERHEDHHRACGSSRTRLDTAHNDTGSTYLG